MAAAVNSSKLVFDDDGQAREVRALEQLLFGDEGRAAATVLGSEQPSSSAAAARRRRPRGTGAARPSPAAPASNKKKRKNSDASALAALVARAEEAADDELFAVDRPAGDDDDDGSDGEEDGAAAPAAANGKQQDASKRLKAAERARRRQAREHAASVWHDPDDETLAVDVSAGSRQKGAARLRKLTRTGEAQGAAAGGGVMTGAEYERALRARHAALAGARGSRWAASALAARRAEEGGGAWSDDEDGEQEGGGRRRVVRRGGGGGGGGGGGDDDDDSDDDHHYGARSVADLLRRGDGLTASAKQRAKKAPAASSAPPLPLPLPQGSLQVARLRDANASAPSAAVVRSVEWHPNGQLLMTAGMDRSVRLFGVDGAHNPLVQGVHLADTPVQRAAFAGADGGVVVAAGRRAFYYVIDLHTGAAERVVAPPAVFAAHGRGRGDAGLAALVRASEARGAAAKRRAAAMAAGAAANAASAAGGARLKSLETFAVTPPSAHAASNGHHQPFVNEPLAAFAGDGGHVAIVSLRTRQPVAGAQATLKVAAGGAGAVRCLTFAGPDSRQLVASAGDGLVYVWDLRRAGASGGGAGTTTPLAVFRDEGCVAPSSLAASRDGRWLACGSSSGVVNVYRTQPGLGAVPVGGRVEEEEEEEQEQAAAAAAFGGGGLPAPRAPLFGSAVASPSPARALMNLVTAADTLAFSPDSQALLAASRLKRDHLRVFHLPALTAFGNWPTGQTPLHYVHSAAFSPGGGMLAVGNAKGRALLYRLLHYNRV
jgi:U3 small nucleolar RNA-associated protein 18